MIRASIPVFVMFTSAITAQITSAIRSNNIVVTAGASQASIPWGSLITAARTISVNDPGWTAAASAWIKPTGSSAFEFSCGSESRGGFISGGGFATAIGGVTWTLSGSGFGTILINFGVGSLYSNESMSVSIPGHGSWTASRSNPTVRVQVPVTITGSLQIVIYGRTSAGAAPGRSYREGVTAKCEFLPAIRPAQQIDLGGGCGMHFWARENISGGQHAMRFDMSSAIPNALVALVFGTKRLSTRIGTSTCILGTDPLGFVVLTATRSGSASWQITLPRGVRVTLQTQAISFDANGQFVASRAIELVFAD